MICFIVATIACPRYCLTCQSSVSYRLRQDRRLDHQCVFDKLAAIFHQSSTTFRIVCNFVFLHRASSGHLWHCFLDACVFRDTCCCSHDNRAGQPGLPPSSIDLRQQFSNCCQICIMHTAYFRHRLGGLTALLALSRPAAAAAAALTCSHNQGPRSTTRSDTVNIKRDSAYHVIKLAETFTDHKLVLPGLATPSSSPQGSNMCSSRRRSSQSKSAADRERKPRRDFVLRFPRQHHTTLSGTGLLATETSRCAQEHSDKARPGTDGTNGRTAAVKAS